MLFLTGGRALSRPPSQIAPKPKTLAMHLQGARSSCTNLPMTAANSKQICQLKITLRGSKPPIWRRVLVPSDTTLFQLHMIIQTVMNWGNYHLHEFRVGKSFYGIPNSEVEDDVTINEKLVRLAKVIRSSGGRFIYVYDFGDDWQHDILLEETLPPADGVRYPVCTAGKLACPPDDSGAIWGYQTMLEVLKHPEHSEYENIREWLGPDWDPTRFSQDEVNEALKGIDHRP